MQIMGILQTAGLTALVAGVGALAGAFIGIEGLEGVSESLSEMQDMAADVVESMNDYSELEPLVANLEKELGPATTTSFSDTVQAIGRVDSEFLGGVYSDILSQYTQHGTLPDNLPPLPDELASELTPDQIKMYNVVSANMDTNVVQQKVGEYLDNGIGKLDNLEQSLSAKIAPSAILGAAGGGGVGLMLSHEGKIENVPQMHKAV